MGRVCNVWIVHESSRDTLTMIAKLFFALSAAWNLRTMLQEMSRVAMASGGGKSSLMFMVAVSKGRGVNDSV